MSTATDLLTAFSALSSPAITPLSIIIDEPRNMGIA
jgi:hypothetical protein